MDPNTTQPRNSRPRQTPRSQQELLERKAFEQKKRTQMRVVYLLFIFVSYISLFLIVASASKTGCVDGRKWVAVGNSLGVQGSQKELAQRGNIYAATGEPLRVTVTYYKLTLDLKADPLERLIKKFGERPVLDTLSQTIFKYFPELKQKTSKSQMLQEWMAVRRSGTKRNVRPIDRAISYEEYKAFFGDSVVMNRYDRNGKYRGARYYQKAFSTTHVYVRSSPYGTLADATIGAIHRETGQGRSGLEKYYNDILAGINGHSYQKLAARNQVARIVTSAPIHGCDIYTTIDPIIQAEVTQALQNTLRGSEARCGAAILMEVSTGRVVAIANLRKKRKDAVYKEYENIACCDLREPGSTIKAASMVIALDRDLISLDEFVDVGNGYWSYGRSRVTDHNAPNGYGAITYEQAFMKSSNVAMAKMIVNGFENDKEGFRDAFLKLGFDSLYCEEIPGAQHSKLDPVKYWDGASLAWAAFGYKSAHPPINILAFYNAIANGGKLLYPRFVDRIVDKSGVVRYSFQPKVLRDSICSDATLAKMHKILRLVVTDGTGKAVNSPLVSISGKTGTAQIYSEEKHNYQGGHYISFCGFFPSENPRYSVMAVMDLPPDAPYYSAGLQTGGVVRAIAEAVTARGTARSISDVAPKRQKSEGARLLSGRLGEVSQFAAQEQMQLDIDQGLQHDTYVNIEPTSQGHWRVSPRQKSFHGVVPDLINLPVSEAMYQLQLRGLRGRLVGQGHVIAQSPVAGSPATAGSIVTLSLGYRKSNATAKSIESTEAKEKKSDDPR